MNAGPFLILHRVRGDAVFDVAEQMNVDGETWWIIPTSGHRAYPWRHWLVEDLFDGSDINNSGHHDSPINFLDGLPADWPDHYVAHKPKRVDVENFIADLSQQELDDLLAAIRTNPKEFSK